MATQKLTLSIDADTVKKAKRYVATHGTNLSRLFTLYLNSLPDNDAPELPPRVSRLAGILPPHTDTRGHRDHLLEKYGQ